MRAVRVVEPGGPEAMVVEEIDDPTPEAGQVVVETAAIGVNFIDTYHRSGLYPLPLPFTPGAEGAGTITAVGDVVDGFAVGDRVAWASGTGSYAEKSAREASSLVPVPDDIDDETAAAVILQGLTAHYLATDTFPIDAASTCLIHAGAGGVGLLLTQIASKIGARVISTAGTEEKAELSRMAGASEVILYRETDFAAEVERIVGPHAIDVVYDGVGKATFTAGLGLLRPRGMMVAFGNASGPPPEVSPLDLMRGGSLFLTRPTLGDYVATRDELLSRASDLFGWIREGSLQVRIGARFTLEEVGDAHRALEGRATTGKVLLTP